MNKSDKLILEYYLLPNESIVKSNDYKPLRDIINKIEQRGKELHERQLMEKASIATDEHE